MLVKADLDILDDMQVYSGNIYQVGNSIYMYCGDVDRFINLQTGNTIGEFDSTEKVTDVTDKYELALRK